MAHRRHDPGVVGGARRRGRGTTCSVRIVVRDRTGQVCQTVPADGVDRILEVPGANLRERRWRT